MPSADAPGEATGSGHARASGAASDRALEDPHSMLPGRQRRIGARPVLEHRAPEKRRRFSVAAFDARSQGRDAWRAYEHEKARWIASHPHASPNEYEEAVRRIAETFGL